MHRVITCFVLAACASTGSYDPCAKPGAVGPSGICLAGTRAPEQLRVMSYNVNFGLAGDPDGVAAVAAAAPDVVVFQETNTAWERALVDGLGARFPHRRFTRSQLAAGGMGVMSRIPIVSIDELPTHGGFFVAWRIVLASPELGKLQLLDVHLRPPISDGGSWVVGYFSTRGNRAQEIEYHLAALDPKLPTIIAGDFNEEAEGLATTRLRDLGYADAIAEHAGTARTWEWPVGSVTLRMQLDHIFHDDHLVAVGAKIVEAGRSDHKPVWADFVRIDP